MNRFIATALLVFATVQPLWAESVKGLYSAVVPVEDYSDGEKNRALREGLESVLVRLTGASAIARKPAVANLLDNAPAYALEFGYVNLDEPGEHGLSVSYTRKEIDSFLRRENLPIWPHSRNPLLVWVLEETADTPKAFATPEENGDIYSLLKQAFADRGMPVRYPLYDLEDQLNLAVDDAWEFNVDDIANASKRYGVHNWLVVRCYQTSSTEWRLAWSLGGEGASTLDNLQAPLLSEALERVVNRAVDRVAAQNTYIASANSGSVVLDVKGIGSFGSYRKLMNLVSGLSMVESLKLKSVSGDRVSLELQVEGGNGVLVEALSHYDQLALSGSGTVPGHLSGAWKTDSPAQ